MMGRRACQVEVEVPLLALPLLQPLGRRGLCLVEEVEMAYLRESLGERLMVRHARQELGGSLRDLLFPPMNCLSRPSRYFFASASSACFRFRSYGVRQLHRCSHCRNVCAIAEEAH